MATTTPTHRTHARHSANQTTRLTRGPLSNRRSGPNRCARWLCLGGRVCTSGIADMAKRAGLSISRLRIRSRARPKRLSETARCRPRRRQSRRREEATVHSRVPAGRAGNCRYLPVLAVLAVYLAVFAGNWLYLTVFAVFAGYWRLLAGYWLFCRVLAGY